MDTDLDDQALEMGSYLRNDRRAVREDLQVDEKGISVFVVEQNANIARSVADRGYVLQTGEVVLSGTAQDLLHDEGIRRAYLGKV